MAYGEGKYYFTGALNGGKSEAFLDLCHTLYNNTQSDLKQDIIALWHDESHLNKFALGREDIKILPPYFTRGEREYWKKRLSLCSLTSHIIVLVGMPTLEMRLIKNH
nr:hypothetical protein [Psychrobacter sp. PraFG1]UNK06540.1 hypothetical protein MN210_06655 [Psychrobacter sp. PraFG1]